MTAPEFIRPANGKACEGCGLRAHGAVPVRHRQTGERYELPLCHRCRQNEDRTVWLQWEPGR